MDGLTAVYGAFPRPRAAFVFGDAAAGSGDRPARPARGGRGAPSAPEDPGGSAPIVGAVQEGYEAVAFALEPDTWGAWRAYDAAVYGLVRDGRTPELRPRRGSHATS